MITRLLVPFSIKGVQTNARLACCEILSLKFESVLGWRFISCHPTVDGLEVVGLFISKSALRHLLHELIEASHPVIRFNELPSSFASDNHVTLYSINCVMVAIERAL